MIHDRKRALRQLAGKRAVFRERRAAARDCVWTPPNGDQVAWFEDPDGNVLSISRHAG